MIKKLIIILLLGVVYSHADILTITSGSQTYGGFYVGDLLGNLNGTLITFVCDDFLHEVNFGESWNVDIVTIGGSNSPRFSDVGKYLDAFWLIDQLPSSPTQTASIQQAIWELFDPAMPLTAPQASYWYNLALQGHVIDTSRFVIYTPLDSNKYQEMIGYNNSVPEVSTTGLLLTALGVTLIMCIGHKLTDKEGK